MMDVSFQNLHSLSKLKIPGTTEYIDCSYNHLTSLRYYSDKLRNVRILRCQNNLLVDTPFIPKLERLYCGDNKITHLPIYHTIIEMKCSNNCIVELPPLPPTLKVLECSSNLIKSLSNLPPGLAHLDCSSNQIETIDYFPKLLVNIKCMGNRLKSIPYVHRKVEYLSISYNPIRHLPNGMENVNYLHCMGCPLQDEKMPCISNIICDSEFTNNMRYTNPGITRLVVIVSTLTRLPVIPPTITTLKFHYPYNSVFHDTIYNVSENIDDMVEKTNIHHRFIHLYYSLRFKKQFMYWLWYLIRRPKIERECHPTVIEGIIESIGMEAFLEL
jgi:hypothetical protein